MILILMTKLFNQIIKLKIKESLRTVDEIMLDIEQKKEEKTGFKFKVI